MYVHHGITHVSMCASSFVIHHVRCTYKTSFSFFSSYVLLGYNLVIIFFLYRYEFRTIVKINEAKCGRSPDSLLQTARKTYVLTICLAYDTQPHSIHQLGYRRPAYSSRLAARRHAVSSPVAPWQSPPVLRLHMSAIQWRLPQFDAAVAQAPQNTRDSTSAVGADRPGKNSVTAGQLSQGPVPMFAAASGAGLCLDFTESFRVGVTSWFGGYRETVVSKF